jgi:hypothetical protein
MSSSDLSRWSPRTLRFLAVMLFGQAFLVALVVNGPGFVQEAKGCSSSVCRPV